jgi:NTP pyrophosphatase (non-canonical NTP hydrolase)
MNETVGHDKFDKFLKDIEKFNKMYDLPVNDIPTDLGFDKLVKMYSIIREEVDEFQDIIDLDYIKDIDRLVMIADLLTDIVVYCFTFAKQYGINMEKTLDIVMQSNFSKLGIDGKPIHDVRGKVMKGPNYWKPEPEIKQLFQNYSYGITENYNEWYETIKKSFKDYCNDVNSKDTVIEVDVLKKCKYYMTNPVCRFKNKTLTTTSQKFKKLNDLENYVKKSKYFIPYMVIKQKNNFILSGCDINEKS